MVVPWRSSNFRGEVMRITSRTSLPALLLDELQPPIEVARSLGSIPIPPTSFVGRESEIADLIALLQRSDVKLITVTGPGGVGKTRLTIRVAEQLRDTFEDGVWFVMLAPVRDPALVPVAIAHVLGLRTSERNVGDALRAYLQARRVLLVLDNFEHLLEATPFLVELLQTLGPARFLTTSRSMLHIYGEHQFQVLPMPVVSRGSGRPPELLEQSPAIRLFWDRASAANSSFELTPENAATIVKICQTLEGLPLGIELAAAQIGFLTPEALLDRLNPRLPTLTGGQQGQPTRFNTMRSAIAWSYDLLDAREQSLLRQLAMFVGGFTIEAANEVTGDLQVRGASTPERLSAQIRSLVDKSLLFRVEASAELRFSMLEVIREFCLEELAARGELDEAKRRHAAYYLTLVPKLTPGMSGTEAAANLARLELELPNMRAALSRAYEDKQFDAALRLATAMYSFWGYRGRLSEGQAWLPKILEHDDASAAARIDGLLAMSGISAIQGDYENANRLCQEASALADEEHAQPGMARAVLLRGVIAEWQGRYREAEVIYAECQRRVEDFGEAHWEMRILALQAEIDVLLGDVARGEARAISAIAQGKAAGYVWVVGSATGVLAYTSLERSDHVSAVGLYQENIARYTALGDMRGIGGAIAGVSGVALAHGQSSMAARLIGAARATIAEIGVAHLGNKGLSDRIEVRIRATISPLAFQSAWETGYALGREWAFAEAQTLHRMVEGARVSALPDAAARSGLTRREVDVLYLLARRLTDKEIADALSISHRTAMHHVSSILAKLALGSRRQVPKWAEQHRII